MTRNAHLLGCSLSLGLPSCGSWERRNKHPQISWGCSLQTVITCPRLEHFTALWASYSSGFSKNIEETLNGICDMALLMVS